MKSTLTMGSALVAIALLAGCAGGGVGGDPSNVDPDGDIEPREISWLLSRPSDGATISIMQELADEYAELHPGFSLNLITTPDRPSYLQRYETLAAANELPEFFDTDATPFARKLADQDRMMDVEALLEDMGLLDDFRPGALAYQRFDDGSLHMIPLEFQAEVFWYNTQIFADAGVEVPATLDDFPQMCRDLSEAGVIPIALNGLDQWPLERYMAYVPFRLTGADYLNSIKTGDAEFSDEVGTRAVQWLADLGEAGCFDDGFSATGYADAQALFTTGRAAVYNIGTWELASLATDAVGSAVEGSVDFFTLPTIDGAVTDANEFVAPSGIGMAVNAATFDPLVRDFLQFVLENYPERYAATGALSPTSSASTVLPDNATDLYSKALALADDIGATAAMPWDTQLDPTSNTRLQQELTLLVQGNISVEEFIHTMDATIAENAPRYFD